MPSEIGNRVIGRNIPIVSHREALRMVAQASMSSCYIDRTGTLVFEELAESTPVDTLNNDNLYTPAKVEVRVYQHLLRQRPIMPTLTLGTERRNLPRSVAINGTKTYG